MIPNFIIIHHSLTKDSGTVSWEANRQYHKEQNGWRDIGYHFGIERIDDTYQIMYGRPPSMIGAHCLGYNNKSLGVCLVGNFSEVSPCQQQWNVSVALCAHLCKYYLINPDNILGHREADKTRACPGVMFDMDKFRNDVENLKDRQETKDGG